MYRTIYVPADHSEFSQAAVEIAVSVAKTFGARLVGSHVYAAKLHDVRFKQMEFTLPDEYKEETELEKQRKIHDALIARGLHLISDSYLDVLASRAEQAGLAFERKHFDGKNFAALVEDVERSEYDLVVLGALGQGAVGQSIIGSVCERLLRRASVDMLVVRDVEPEQSAQAPLLVCFDGSDFSYGALDAGCALASACDRPLEILAVASSDAERQLLHEHLQVATGRAERAGLKPTVELVDGAPRATIVEAAQQRQPWLVVVGRMGIDAVEDESSMQTVGATAEHVVRYGQRNVLVSARAVRAAAQPRAAAAAAG